jgi:hypothetical protein
VVAAVATLTLMVGGTLGYFAIFPDQAPAFVRATLGRVGLAEEAPPPPPTCPLSGVVAPGGTVPDRPALAIKVENAPEARPQSALNTADVVVEEPVEGGYTRFIAIFHCDGSDRVGPVRSGRTTDPDYLRQLGDVVFGYAGGVAAVEREVERARLVDVNYVAAADAYTRDPGRVAPHDLYTTTEQLWRAGQGATALPEPLFTYAAALEGRARRITSAHVPFSAVSDVWWTWSRRSDAWLRSHGEVPHLTEEAGRVSATNVVIQVVEVADSAIVDAAGNASPDVELTGSGRAFVLRDGRLIAGRWERADLGEGTLFVTRDGTEIALSPGRTWVELVPSSVHLQLLR